MEPAKDRVVFFDRRIRAGYLLGFIMLLTSYLLILFVNGEVQKQAATIVHTNLVLTQVQSLLSDLKDAETGFRGYLVIKDRRFLDPFYGGENMINTGITNLRNLTKDNPAQQRRIDTLEGLIAKNLEIIKTGMQLFQNSDKTVSDSMKILVYAGKQQMEGTGECVQRIKATELNLLDEHTKGLKAYNNAVKIINIASLLVVFLLTAYSMITYRREKKLKKQSHDASVLNREELGESLKDLKSANEELIVLRRNEKFAVTGRIARTIAHEVKNPLTNINLAVEQLKDQMPPDEESNFLFSMIARNGNRINQLVSDLLNSTKVSELKVERVSVNTLLDETLESAKDRIELSNVTVEKNYTTDPCDVAVDKEQIKIAFLNIIVNAVEATEAGTGKLIIKTEKRFNKCVVIIKDNGRGMAEEDLLKLFEPYFTRKPKGTGLGLTHTQTIVFNHKGSIHVTSKEGGGTVFEIILNLA